MASNAMSTAGVRLVYGDATVDAETGVITPPATWTKIPDIKSFPDFTSAPNMLETTTLDELEYTTYIAGLQDLGGSIEFTANFTPELIDAVADAAEAAASGKRRMFALEIPAPVSTRYSWLGEAQPIKPMGGEVNAVLETTVYISMESALTETAITG